MTSLPRLTNRRTALLLVPLLVAGLLLIPRGGGARADITKVVSSVNASDGSTYSITNHLVGLNASGPSTAVASSAQPSGEYLVVWAGDQNIGDASAGSLVQRAQRPEVNPEKLKNIQIPDDAPGNDFLAVIDADKTSPNYGKVVNTVTVGPLVENEPHHVQYIWHKGNKVYAGGLFSDATYVFDVGNLPQVSLSGVNLPTDTPCGSVPDAYWVLHDGTAYGTYMGGPDLPGPCLYTNGETRIGNGFAGTPGSLVHLDQNGKTLSEVPAALPTAEDPTRCPGLPTTVASCANPHGIQVREDLGRMITTDYAEPKNVPIDPIKPADSNLFRDTVRIWDITDENNPKVTAVSVMPDGPRHERNPGHEEPRGIMEGTVTNLPNHKGAFSESMCGGVIYYTPDITVANPTWTEVFDDTAASKVLNPHITEGAGCDGGGWLQTSLDDRYLYHAVIGRNEGSLDASDPGVPKMVYTLDVQKLIAASAPACNIDTIKEVFDGGAEGDCPTVSGVLELPDGTSGGPHWGALDNFKPLGDGTWGETTDVKRIAVSNYFVARSAVDGNHKVCMVSVGTKGELTLDTSFRDEDHGTPCVDFNRTDWPHGKTGAAKPHSELFIVPNAKLR